MRTDTDFNISEREFMANEFDQLRQLAEDIETVLLDFDIDCSTIAKACHLDPRIVRRAKKCIRVNGDCERRIRYFIEQLRNK